MSKFTESFNADRLAYLIQNKERFAVRVYEQYYDPFLIPKKYLQKSSGGLIKVSYHQPGGRNFGRFFANGGIGLQGMAREIRHTISGEFYDDLDMVNAHPVILQHLCVKHKIIHDSLSEYIEHREKHIADILAENSSSTREDIKKVFLSLINGGQGSYDDIKNPTRFLRQFKIEAEMILDDVAKAYPHEFQIRNKQHPTNAKGSTVNAIMCEHENQILQHIMAFYKEKGLITTNAVLCFDGIMIPKSDQTAGFIPECEAYILQKTKIAMRLKIKPMDEGFDLPDEIRTYIEHKSFDARDDFCWLDFDDKYRGQCFTSKEEVLEQTRVDVNRVFCRVRTG